jgi:hypothetical protein
VLLETVAVRAVATSARRVLEAADMIEQTFSRPEIQQRYELYARTHHGEIDIVNLAETMFNAGERHAIQTMTEFSDILPRVGRIEERVAAIHRLLMAIRESE